MRCHVAEGYDLRVLLSTALGRGIGGVTSHIESLATALEGANVRSEVVWPDPTNITVRAFAAVRSFGSRDKARRELTKAGVNRTWAKVQTAVRSGGVQVLHVHDVLLASRVFRDRKRVDVPVVLTVHGPLSREVTMAGITGESYLSFLRDAERLAYQSANAIIAVDTGQKQIIVNDYNIPPGKISVIYNSVDTELFAPTSLNRQRISRTARPFFLVPRRLVPKNGVGVAIEALHALLNNGCGGTSTNDSDIELWVAGDGPQRPTLAELASALNVADRVRFLGAVDHSNMVSLLRDCIGVIIPSVPVAGVVEASSIAALEGMSVGKPVLASRIGGLSEIIDDGKTGYLFEAGDAEKLAELLQRVLRNQAERENIGRNARRQVLTAYSYRAWADQVLTVYRSVLASSTVHSAAVG